MSARQPTYGDLIEVLGLLPVLVRERRRQRRIPLRVAAEEIGVGFNTVRRLERGDDCPISTALKALEWLDRSAA